MKLFDFQRIILYCTACFFLLASCHSDEGKGLMERFPTAVQLQPDALYTFDSDSLMRPEKIACCNDRIVVYDLHSGYNYTLFDARQGNYITRLGAIGEGPGEIPAYCYDYHLEDNRLSAFNNQTRQLFEMQLKDDRTQSHCLLQCNLPDAQFTSVVPVGDSLYLGAGVVGEGLQYALFSKGNALIDSGIPIYNAADSTFVGYTRYLSNQGVLIKHPSRDRFAFAVNLSANLDFIEVANERIRLRRSLRLGNPIVQPTIQTLAGSGQTFSVNPNEQTIWGYIDLCATEEHVYALYSENTLYKAGRRSDTVIVFDWDGHPVTRLRLHTDAYRIASDADGKYLYALVQGGTEDWNIIRYPL